MNAVSCAAPLSPAIWPVSVSPFCSMSHVSPLPEWQPAADTPPQADAPGAAIITSWPLGESRNGCVARSVAPPSMNVLLVVDVRMLLWSELRLQLVGQWVGPVTGAMLPELPEADCGQVKGKTGSENEWFRDAMME